MVIKYLPLTERQPDTQYSSRLRMVLKNGQRVGNLPHGVEAITCFGTLPQMVFDLRNGVPVITERNIPWRQAIAEIIAFINGAKTYDEVASYGCKFWESYRGTGTKIGLGPDDMGEGSYGPTFHDYETPNGLLNQIEQVIEQIRNYPGLRTHRVTSWKPWCTAEGPNRKVFVAPCHGELHFRVLNGRLHMTMNQRSADLPTGVPYNMTQYAAFLLMMCQVTGYEPGLYVHGFIGDAHIYTSQLEGYKDADGNETLQGVETVLGRSPRPFPILRIDPDIKNIFDFKANHFELEEYNPHPGFRMPFEL